MNSKLKPETIAQKILTRLRRLNNDCGSKIQILWEKNLPLQSELLYKLVHFKALVHKFESEWSHAFVYFIAFVNIN